MNHQTIAQIVGIDLDEARSRIDAATLPFKEIVSDRVAFERTRTVSTKRRAEVRKKAEKDISEAWADTEKRLALCPAKDVLTSINRQLEKDGLKAVSFQRIARSMKLDDVSTELSNVLLRVNG